MMSPLVFTDFLSFSYDRYILIDEQAVVHTSMSELQAVHTTC